MQIFLLIQTKQPFSLDKALLWIVISYFSKKQWHLDGFVSAFGLSRCYLMDWSGVDCFISCLDSHSDGTHSL